ncbi:hypothetical protein EVAR_30116_1 [Eumeta japonica]|uniref:Uncharacterized protein n=1 Tax=Eumeta variegata TaxID=151549 RepID=A0A4C1WG94_EUMVA|nr:hypothetical protein EVAR_30116_1 [Eumeta japonica]
MRWGPGKCAADRGDAGMAGRAALALLLLLVKAAPAPAPPPAPTVPALHNATRPHLHPRRPAPVEDANGEDLILPEDEDEHLADLDYYDEEKINISGQF